MVTIRNKKTDEKRTYLFLFKETDRILWTIKNACFKDLPATKLVELSSTETDVDLYVLNDEWVIDPSNGETGLENSHT